MYLLYYQLFIFKGIFSIFNWKVLGMQGSTSLQVTCRTFNGYNHGEEVLVVDYAHSSFIK